MTLPLSVIIVTHFSALDLAECLPSLPGASAQDFDVVVVDNATTDDSVREIMSHHPEARFIEAGGNLGFGSAVNRAAATVRTDCEWILIANPDTIFTPGAIDRMLASATSDASIGSLGPRIENEDGSVYPSARPLPSLRMGIGHALFARAWPSNPWSRRYHQFDAVERGTEIEVGWLSGACVLVRREAFDEVGGFDEKFFMYFEDVDLGRRLGQAGWKNIYAPSAVIRHMGGTSTARYPKTMLTMHHKSAYSYLAEKYRPWYLWPLRVVLRGGLAARLWLMTRRLD